MGPMGRLGNYALVARSAGSVLARGALFGSGRRLPVALLATIVGATCLGLVLAPQSWAAEELSSEFDKAGVTHNDQCLPLSGSNAIMYGVNGKALTNENGQVTDGPESVDCAASSKDLYVEGIESLKAVGETMYYVWSQNASPGFVRASELTLKSGQPKLNSADAAGNGEKAEAAPGEPYYTVTPTYIPAQQCYREIAEGKAGQNCGSEYYHYEPYGQPTGNDPHYTLMTWSWINVGGGGIARAVVPEGMHFYPSNVRPITETSYTEHGEANGSVTARYGFVNSGEKLVYGWMVTSHDYNGQCVNHMSYAGGGAPLPETLCPGESTGGPTNVAPRQATLTGTVYPNGSDTHYYFQYGTSPSYGETQPLPPGTDAGSTGSVPASTAVSLSPGTTYHYRIVATNSVGTSYGADKEFATPGPVEATTGEATKIGATEATLGGTVNPRGYDAKYYYQYGETTSYGKTTPEGDAGAGQGAVSVPATITGLKPGRLYHYRLIASSGGITSEGKDKTFKTLEPSFTGDGMDDLVTCENNQYAVAVSNGKNFEESPASGVWKTGWGCSPRTVVGDFTGNGLDDIAVPNASNNTWAVMVPAANGKEFVGAEKSTWLTKWGAEPIWDAAG